MDTPTQSGSGNSNGAVDISTYVGTLSPGQTYEYKFCGRGDTVTTWVCVGDPDGSGPEAFSTIDAPDLPPGLQPEGGAGDGCMLAGTCTPNGKPIPYACQGDRSACSKGTSSVISWLKKAYYWVKGAKGKIYHIEWKFLKSCGRAIPSPGGISATSGAAVGASIATLGQGYKVAVLGDVGGVVGAGFTLCLAKDLGG